MQIPLHQWFISDAALALVIFAATALFVLWSMPFAGWRETLGLLRGLRSSPTSGQFSLETAAATFQQFQALSMYEVTRMRAAYARLGRAHKRMGYDLGYPRKLDRLEDATRTNAAVAERIAHMAKEELGTEASSAPSVPSGSLNRAREAFRHFIRDWSEEGAPERTRIFEPILKVLDKVPINEREKMRVLVPGCGLGRLAWEVSELGYTTTANELSHFMTISLQYLLSPSSTPVTNHHTIYPYAHWFSHQRSTSNLFHSVSFPDALPRLSRTFDLNQGDFFDLRAPQRGGDAQDDDAGHDFIVTLFFIDTSLNIMRTLEHIYALLRPGGTWINLGPLLWTGGAQASLELSLDEVLQLAKEIGFDVEGTTQEGVEGVRARRTVECEYTADPRAMMKWLYQAEFWVATK